MIGFRTDMNEILQTADVFAFPSIREGLGIAAIEALACGVPLIVADNRGTREYLHNDKNGLICDAFDRNAFVAAIDKVYSNVEYRKKLADYCRESVIQFSTEETVRTIMGVYNELNKDILMEAVNSILHQTFEDFEFIIYDDGSCPEAATLLREVEGLDERIKLIGQDENHGLAFSLNACIDEAKGKYIARMDADDISYPERLMKQKKFLDKYQEYSWVGCNIDVFDQNGVWGERKMPEFPIEQDYLRFSPYAHPTVMYRASIFDTNEGYVASKETLRCEDYEIFMRLRRAGLKGANIQDKLLAYRENKDSYKKRSFRHRWNEAKCRYRNFKALGILLPKGWIYVLRPIAACAIPYWLLAWYKRKESSIQQNRYWNGEKDYEEKSSYGIDSFEFGNTADSVQSR